MTALKNSMKITANRKVLKRMIQCKEDYKKTGERKYLDMFEGAVSIIIKDNQEGIQKLAIQNSAVSSDFGQIGGEPFQMITEEDYFDRGWEMAFKMRDVVPGTMYFNLYTAQTAIEWKKMQEGERLDQQGFQGENEKIFADYHGAAVSWTDKLMRTSTPAGMIDTLRALLVGYWVEKADIYYQLISAATTVSGYTDLQGTSAETLVQRVAKTINAVSNTLGEVNKDKGYGNTAAIPRVMNCHPDNAQIIEASFRLVTNAAVSGAQSGEEITGPRINRNYSYSPFITKNEFQMYIPGFKSQRCDLLNPMALDDNKDIYTLNQGRAMWAIHGGAIGDTDQFKGGKLS